MLHETLHQDDTLQFARIGLNTGEPREEQTYEIELCFGDKPRRFARLSGEAYPWLK